MWKANVTEQPYFVGSGAGDVNLTDNNTFIGHDAGGIIRRGHNTFIGKVLEPAIRLTL
jgi:hypothetical protein